MLQFAFLLAAIVCIVIAGGLGYRADALRNQVADAGGERIAALTAAAEKAALVEQARAREIVDLRENLRGLLAAYQRKAAAQAVAALPVVWPVVTPREPAPFVAPRPLTRDPYARMEARLREAAASCQRP